MRTLDVAPFFRSTIGFDRMLEALRSAQVEQPDAFPPYDIEKLAEDRYRITLAVAGFTRDELHIVVQDNTLSVRGLKREQEDGVSYLHRGIGVRSFERRFELADFVDVTEASLDEGLLRIELVRETPEEMKPRHIPIVSDKVSARSAPKAA